MAAILWAGFLKVAPPLWSTTTKLHIDTSAGVPIPDATMLHPDLVDHIQHPVHKKLIQCVVSIMEEEYANADAKPDATFLLLAVKEMACSS